MSPFIIEHACRLISPEKVKIVGSGNRTAKNGKVYRVLFGIPHGETGSVEQAYRYPKLNWSVLEARAHCNRHDGILFEPAITKEEYIEKLEKDIELLSLQLESEDKEPIICFDKSDLEKAKHRRDNCMLCKSVPVYEILWAEGKGHAWFCKQHLKSWTKEGDGWHEIDAIKEITNGEAGMKWKDNTNPNLINKLKEIIKEESIDVETDVIGKEETEIREITIFDISKKEDEHKICGIIYIPNDKPDTDGDVVTDALEIEKASDYFMEKSRKFKLGHKFEFTKQITILQNVIAPVDFRFSKNGHLVKAGTWYMVLRINSPSVWKKIKSGEYTGLSMAGSAMSSEI